MELMLKIDLTEEQYNDLMTKSYHELFETDSFKKVLAATVSEGILDFLKGPTGQSLIKKTFTGDSYYDSGRNTDFGKKLFDTNILEGKKCRYPFDSIEIPAMAQRAFAAI